MKVSNDTIRIFKNLLIMNKVITSPTKPIPKKNIRKNTDNYISNSSLCKITKGTGIMIIGTFLSVIMVFIFRVVIARHWPESDYGIFSMALVILNIFLLIGSLGFRRGIERSIAYARGRKQNKKIYEFIYTSVLLSLVVSIFLVVLLFLSSRFIAVYVFNDSNLIFPLIVFSFSIPFLALTDVLVSIFRGFENFKPTIYFQTIGVYLIFLLLLGFIVVLDFSFNYIFIAYTTAIFVNFVFLILYTFKFLKFPSKFSFGLLNKKSTKELLLFCLPLMGTFTLQMVTNWSDTLLIGYFRFSSDVGLYNAARPLSQFISTPLNAMLLVYLPIITKLYSQKKIHEMKTNYSILTKWLIWISFPLFVFLFLYPEEVIKLLFGSNYMVAANTLRILSLGLIFNNLLGPNATTLLALGRSLFVMWSTLSIAIVNVILNIVLIPLYGIEGAAIATIVSVTSINVLMCIKLFSLTKLTPLSKNLIKPSLIFLVLIFLIYHSLDCLFMPSFLMLPLVLIIFYIIYLCMIIITKSFDKEDMIILEKIELKIGVHIKPLKYLIKKLL